MLQKKVSPCCQLLFTAKLGEDSWVDRDPEIKTENLLIGILHSQTLPHNKNRVLSSLSGQGSCRVVVATTALGMGLHFPNRSHIMMYGFPDDVEAMVQQVGRAGRGGLQAHAIVYAVKQHTTDPAVKTVLETGITSCLRKALYCHSEEQTTSVDPGHLCCTHCHSVCSCEPEGCGEPTPKYEHFQGEVSSPDKCRMITPEDKLLIRDLLHNYRSSLRRTIQIFTQSTQLALVLEMNSLMRFQNTAHRYLTWNSLSIISLYSNWNMQNKY